MLQSIRGLLAAAIAFSTHAAAQSGPPVGGELALGEPMVVTAGRTAQAADRVPARVSVITRDDIERAQAPDLLELLRLEAGVDIARAGGAGGQTGVFLRGTNSNHVLVLIDGVRVSAAGTGAFTWEILDPALIERIEIVRGPRAARWGSDAIGGVIQIFTRAGDGAAARAAYGRYRDRSLAGSAGFSTDGGGLGISASARRVGGFSAQNPGGFAFHPDDDGFRNTGAGLSGHQAWAAGTLEYSARVADGRIEFDQGVSDFRNGSAGLSWRHASRGPWQWQASAGMLRDRLETENDFGGSETVTRRVQAGLQAQRDLGRGDWLVGVDAWRESGYSADQWRDDRSNFGAWTGIDGRAGRMGYEASLRVDDDEHFGTATTGNLAGSVEVGTTGRVFASIGRAFRVPNFNQLYSPGVGGLFAGNPDLDPEVSTSAEAGADFSPGDGHRLGISVYQTRIRDLIDFAGADFRAVNVDRAQIRGVELSHDYTGEHWRVQARVTWQDAEDRDTGADLLRRADEKYSLAVDRDFGGGHRAGAEVVHVGTRADVGGVDLSAYTLVNLRAVFALGWDLDLEARVDNATDRDYQPLDGFNARGRSLFVALAWRR